METAHFLPVDLSNRILYHEVDIDTGPLSQDLLAETVQLYVEAISYYSALSSDKNTKQNTEVFQYARRSKFYQGKIQRLLVRSDVQHCLVGKQGTYCPANLQKELERVSQHAPEQARALAVHYQTRVDQQRQMIESNLAQQKIDLRQRIEQRSRSKHRASERPCPLNLPVPPAGRRVAIGINF